MICEEIIKGEKGYLCGTPQGVYACSECDESGKNCENCIPIPKPEYTPNPREYSGVEEIGEYEYQGIMDIIKDKNFLIGFGAGLLVGFLFFGRK